jgi:hypothetical protein
MVVDGVDFAIKEPLWMGFCSAWFSHKFKGPGVRYELATCINTGDIVWFHGPFPCGSHPDLKIYRLGLKKHLLPGEKVWGDKGYQGDVTIITRYTAKSPEHLKEINRARARHETVNGRFKRFKAMSNVFRHSLQKHGLIYTSVAVVLQIEQICGYGPFECTSKHNSALEEEV